MKTKLLSLLVFCLSFLLYTNTNAQVTQSICNASFSIVPDSTGYGFQFQNTSTGNPSSSFWSFGDGSNSSTNSPFHYYNANGYFIVCLTISDTNCQSTYCDTVYAGPQGSNCQANYTFNNIPGTTLFNFTNLSSGANLICSWSFGDGGTSTAQNPSHTYSQPGIYTVCLDIYNFQGCGDSLCTAITVVGGNTNCDASFASYDTSGYNLFIANMYSPNLSYTWDYGDGAIGFGYATNYQYAQPGLYYACLTVYDSSNNCTDTQCDTVLASGSNNGTCSAQYTVTYNGNGSITFNPPANSANTYYAWNFGDGSSSTLSNPVHTYANGGLYTVCLTVTNFTQTCTDYYCNLIQSGGTTGNCDATFGAGDSSGTIFFYPMNYSPTAFYTWDFGDGSTGTGAFPTHNYNVNGYVTACCTVYDSILNCSATWCDSVYTGNGGMNCAAYFNYSVQGLTAYFYGSSNMSNVITWDWNFGNGVSSTLQSPSITFANAGNYWVCLTITTSAGCINTTCMSVSVTNSTGNCNAQFQAFDSSGVTYFIPYSTSMTQNFFWDFGDNTVGTGPYPTHQYSGNGPWIACLTITDSAQNCTDTWCDTIYSNSTGGSCQAYFSASLDTINGAQFYNLSGGNYTSLYWSFGDGTSSNNQNPYHIYANSGTYIVCLTVYGNNCQDSYCDSVVIGSGVNCVPQFYTYPDSTLGSGNMNFGLFNNCPGWTYSWSFGDNTSSSSGTNPAHQYGTTGWYTVCVEATDSNGNVITWCDSIYAFRVLFAGIQTNNNSVLPAVAYPNPSNGPVTIQYTLQKATQVAVEVLSIDGKLRYSNIQEQGSGLQEQHFNTNDFPSGIYLVRIHAGGQEASLKIIVQ